MTTRLRGLLLRASVVGALVAAPLVLVAAPARADVNLKLQDIDAVNLTVGGGSSTLSVKVRNEGDDKSDPTTLTITVPLSEQQVKVGNAPGCQTPNGNVIVCAVKELSKDQTAAFAIPLTPPATSNLEPGKDVDGTGKALLGTGDDKNFKVTLKAGNTAATVTEVSGTVVDSSTNNPVPGALVLLKDSARHEFNGTTNESGQFSIKPTADKPIAPGTLTLGAAKQGFANATLTRDGQAGRALATVQIRLDPTPNASASPGASEPAGSESAAPTTDLAGPAKGSGDGGGTNLLSWVLSGVGGLLFLLGIAAIVLMVVRKRRDRGDDYDDVPAMAGAAMGGYYAGANDQTAVVSPTGVVLDEFPDPYAAAPASPGYGGPTTAYQPPGYAYGGASPETQRGGWPPADQSTRGYGGPGAGGGGTGGHAPGGTGGYGPGGYGPGGYGAVGNGSGGNGNGGYGSGGAGGYGNGGHPGYGNEAPRGGDTGGRHGRHSVEDGTQFGGPPPRYDDEPTGRFAPPGYSGDDRYGRHHGA